MRVFVDTANLVDIADALDRGFVAGITTNPSLLSREEKRDFESHVQDIITLLKKHGHRQMPLSVEVFAIGPDQMIQQAERFMRVFDYDGLHIKVPIGWDELRVISHIRRAGGRVNCTAIMNYNQAVMAVSAGANFVSLFWNRILDWVTDPRARHFPAHFPSDVVSQVHHTLIEQHIPAQIIVGSIRSPLDVHQAFVSGADIVTVPPKFLPELCQHPKTDEVVEQFVRDFAHWSAPAAL